MIERPSCFNFSSISLKNSMPKTRSKARQSTILDPVQCSMLRGNKICLPLLCASSTASLGRSSSALVNSNILSHLVVKGLFYTHHAPNAATSGSADQIVPAGREAVDPRLLAVKLGGWGHVSSKSGEPPRQPRGVGELRAGRGRISLHGAPRALPSYLVKFLNQLMRHGKKGVSLGLLAESLPLFCKGLEGVAPANPYTSGAQSVILLKQRGGEAPVALHHRVMPGDWSGLHPLGVDSQGVPSFPFHLASFPGPSFGETPSQPKRKIDNLSLGLPFLGGLLPHSSRTSLSFVRRGAEHRGLLRLKASQGAALLAPESDASNARLCIASNARLNTVSPNGMQSQNAESNLISNRSLANAGVGVKMHTKRSNYFWSMKGLDSLPLHHRGGKVQGAVFPTSVLSFLSRAISNIEPSLEVRKKKIAGITRQIPCVVPKARGERLAIRWIVSSARERARKRGKRLSYCLAEELIDAYHKRGEPRQRRDSLHKAAESNRSFLRYRWW